MGLAPTLGREVAHDVVYQCCREALAGETPFVDALMARPEIAGALSRDEAERLADPANYLGAAPAMARALAAARRA